MLDETPQSTADETGGAAEPDEATTPARPEPLSVSDLIHVGSFDLFKESAVELWTKLHELEKQATGTPLDPRLLFYAGTEYEVLWTAHGLIWLRPLMGQWYWVNQPIALGTIVERWPRYRAYVLARTRWAIEKCDEEHRFCVLDGRESDAYFWGERREQLKQELERVESTDALPA